MSSDIDWQAVYRAWKLRVGSTTSTSLVESYSGPEVAFLRAIDRYKRVNRRPFPTWSEVLAVLKALEWQEPG